MTEPWGPRMRPGEALRRLHEALPRRANFSIDRGNGGDAEWAVAVRQPDPSTGADQYQHTVLGDDLGALVEEAVVHYRQWAATSDTPAQAGKPPMISAPGAAERRDATRFRKDAS